MQTWFWYLLYKKGKKGQPIILGKVKVDLNGWVGPESWDAEVFVKKSDATRKICKAKRVHRYDIRVIWIPT